MAGTFFFGFGVGTYWVLLNLYYRELGLLEGLIGRILSAQSLGTALMAIPVSLLIARMRLKWLLMLAAVATAAGSALLVVLKSMELLILAAVFTGAAFIIHHVVSAPFFMRNSTPKERIYLFAVNYSVEILTSVVGVGLGGWFARYLGQSLGSDLLGLRITLLGASAVLALAVVPYIFIHSPAPPRTASNVFRGWRARWPRGLEKLIAPNFLVGLGAGLIIPFLNLYFRDRFDLDAGAIGRVFAVSQGLTALGFAVGPVFARRLGMVQSAVWAQLLSIPFFITLAFTTHLEIAVVAFWFRAALMNMSHPINRNFAMEVVEADQQAFTNAVMEMSWSVSWMVSTQVGGLLIEHYGFALPMLITVVLYFVSSLLYLGFFHDYERRVLVPKREAEGAAEA